MDKITQNSKTNSVEFHNENNNNANDNQRKGSQASQLEYDRVRKGSNVKKVHKRDGSLLNLFQSEYFTIHMLFRYLYKA